MLVFPALLSVKMYVIVNFRLVRFANLRFIHSQATIMTCNNVLSYDDIR